MYHLSYYSTFHSSPDTLNQSLMTSKSSTCHSCPVALHLVTLYISLLMTSLFKSVTFDQPSWPFTLKLLFLTYHSFLCHSWSVTLKNHSRKGGGVNIICLGSVYKWKIYFDGVPKRFMLERIRQGPPKPHPNTPSPTPPKRPIIYYLVNLIKMGEGFVNISSK